MPQPVPSENASWILEAAAQSSVRLASIPFAELREEMLHRLVHGHGTEDEAAVDRLYQLREVVRRAIDVHHNRFSRQRYSDTFSSAYRALGADAPAIAGSTFVELGCGSWNPGAVGFLFLLLGARRSYVVDCDPPKNPQRAVAALAELAALMFVDAESIAGEHAVSHRQLLEHLQGFDLARLHRGDSSGLDPKRLVHLMVPAQDLPLDDGEADFVYSGAFFEHVADVDAVIAETARVLKPGGMASHVIDATDHRRYPDPRFHALDYLKIDVPGEAVHLECKGMIYDMNRVRPREYAERFRRHGLEVVSYRAFQSVDVDHAMRARFVEPYRSMPLQELAEVMAHYIVRKPAGQHRPPDLPKPPR
jgi:SAM-dependent methyltransferase